MRTYYEAYLTTALQSLESAFECSTDNEATLTVYSIIKDVKRLLEEANNDNQNESN